MAIRAPRFDPYILLVILFSLFTIGPLLQPGYQWNAHDARHSVYFLFEFDRGFQDGTHNFYPRWQPDFAFGYGYPFFNIYGPLSTYFGEAFHLLGLDFTDAVKMVFALSVTCSGLAMYGFVKQALGRQAGLVAAVAYMVTPYRLIDLYVRAALAESVAYLFVPLVLWGVWATLHRPRLANVLGLAFAYAALMLTSPLVTLLLTFVLVFYVAALALARLNDEQPWRRLSRESALPLLGHLGHILIPMVLSLLLGLGLCAVFALPATTENRFVRVDQWYGGRYAWGGDFVEFFQLFSPRWGFGASVPGPDDDVSFQLGAVPVVLSLFALVPLFRRRRSQGCTSPSLENNVGQACRRQPVAFHPSWRSTGHGVSFENKPPCSAPIRDRSAGEAGSRIRPERRVFHPPWRRAGHDISFAGMETEERADPIQPTPARLTLFFAALTAVVVFLMLGASAPLWQALPLARLAQFPWRLLALTVVSMAFLCGAAAGQVRSKSTILDVPTLILVTLLILGSLPYMRAEMSQQEVSLAGLMRFQQSADEMTGSTAWVRSIPSWSPIADYYIAGEPLTSRINYDALYRQQGRPHARTVALDADSELVEYSTGRSILLTFNTFYYPGWHAYLLEAGSGDLIDEVPIALRGDLGLITVRVPAGQGRVLLRFEDTVIRRLGTAMTYGSLAVVGLLLLGRLVFKTKRAPAR